MKKTLLLFIFLMLISCSKPPKTLTKLPADAVLLAFGDSLTYGHGASAEHDYPALLAGMVQRQVINEGVNGEISADGLKRLPALLDEYQPALLILIHGGNDLLHKIPEDQTAQNLMQMIKEAKQRNIQVVMMGVPPPTLFLLSSAEFYETVAEAEKIPVDLKTVPEILSDKALKSDLIHPNDAGYKQLADAVYKLLQEGGAL